MSYDFVCTKSKCRLTLNNQIVRVIIDALTMVSPATAKFDQPCQQRSGAPPPGMWCPDKFSDNSGRWVRPDELRCIIKIIDDFDNEIEAYLMSNNELEYKPFFEEFRDFCVQTLPPNGSDDSGYGFQVK